MSSVKTYTAAEAYRHTSKDDCWLVIRGKVYDITKFLEEHPGGDEILIEAAGKDATNEFDDIGHSDEAVEMLKDYFIGNLEGGQTKTTTAKKTYGSSSGSSSSGSSTQTLVMVAVVLILVAVLFLRQ